VGCAFLGGSGGALFPARLPASGSGSFLKVPVFGPFRPFRPFGPFPQQFQPQPFEKLKTENFAKIAVTFSAEWRADSHNPPPCP
jgi:hypothetical protein